MSPLQEYLIERRARVRANRIPAALATAGPNTQKAPVTVEGRSGVRRIRIRDFQILLDSGPNLAGYSLGPSSQELFLGTVASCVTHTFLIHCHGRRAQRGTAHSLGRLPGAVGFRV